MQRFFDSITSAFRNRNSVADGTSDLENPGQLQLLFSSRTLNLLTSVPE
jgi:hypothetical protein